jgi:hypothetical protein
MELLGQDSRSLDRDLNPGPPEYEVEVANMLMLMVLQPRRPTWTLRICVLLVIYALVV